MRKPIIGVMGPGSGATDEDLENAYRLGLLIAKQGWITLSGGRNSGVMDAVNKGAKKGGGLTIGILPTVDKDMISNAVDIPIITGMGSARNNINVLSSDVVVACGIGAGTASEIALALKAGKDVILLRNPESSIKFFAGIGKNKISAANVAEEAISVIKRCLGKSKC